VSEQLFEAEDVGLLQHVLELVPDLLAVALAAKRAKAMGLTFPVERVEDLFQVLGEEESLSVGRHVLGRQAISRFMPEGFFPIQDEDQLLRRSYVAMVACREEQQVPGAAKRQAQAVAPPVLSWRDESTVSG
jgi:hypothetical protein